MMVETVRIPWKKKGNEPIELDKIVQNWQRKLSSIVGGGPRTSAAGSSGGYVLAVILIVAWALTGFYRVDQAERGIEQRFGAYTITTLPGSPLALARIPLRWSISSTSMRSITFRFARKC